jgi:hypothetical protein
MKSKIKVKFYYDAKGKKEAVVITTKDFEKMIDELEELEDLYTAYKRTKSKSKSIPYDQAMKAIFGNESKK